MDLEIMVFLFTTGTFLIGIVFLIICACLHYYHKAEFQNEALTEVKMQRDNLHQENKNLNQENKNLHREYQQAKDDLYQENISLLTQCKDLEYDFAKQSREMGDLMIDFLKASHSLHARGIFERFQKTFVSPQSDKSRKKTTRFTKWEDFAKSGDEKVKDLEKVFVRTTQSLPKAAVELYSQLSTGIHSFHNNTSSKIYLVKSELSDIQLQFLKLLCEFLKCAHKVKVCEYPVNPETENNKWKMEILGL